MVKIGEHWDPFRATGSALPVVVPFRLGSNGDYAVPGAYRIPHIALILLRICGSGRFLGEKNRDRPTTNLRLIQILLFFAGAAETRIWQKLG